MVNDFREQMFCELGFVQKHVCKSAHGFDLLDPWIVEFRHLLDEVCCDLLRGTSHGLGEAEAGHGKISEVRLGGFFHQVVNFRSWNVGSGLSQNLLK